MAAKTSTATPGTTGIDWSFLGDESFYITVAGLIAAVLASVGLGHLASSVRTAIDAAAGSVALAYVGGRAHQRGKVITALTNAAEAAVSAVAPPDVAQIADQAAQTVTEYLSKALAGATVAATTTASSTSSAPAAAPAAPAS